MKKKRRILIATLFSAIVCVVIVLTCLVAFLPQGECRYIAHRGYGADAVDNTVKAFSDANLLPYYGIETDIRQTKDGVLVCQHDKEAVFADGTKYIVEETNYADLISKPLKNDKSSEDAFICSFNEYLRTCKEGGKAAIVELKDEFTEEMIENVLLSVDANYDRAKCVFIAFDYDSLMRMRAKDKNINLQYLSGKLIDGNIDKCLNSGISVDVKYWVANKGLVRKFHDKGLTVNVWTVDNKIIKRIMKIYGVDYITSNVFYE